jgi:hypothetical protein
MSFPFFLRFPIIKFLFNQYAEGLFPSKEGYLVQLHWQQVSFTFPCSG